MRLEFIIIAIFAVSFSFILFLYVINSTKMKKKSGQKEEKSQKSVETTKVKKVEVKPKDDGGKVEVESEILTEKPVEKAMKEANIEFQINEAFEKIKMFIEKLIMCIIYHMVYYHQQNCLLEMQL